MGVLTRRVVMVGVSAVSVLLAVGLAVAGSEPAKKPQPVQPSATPTKMTKPAAPKPAPRVETKPGSKPETPGAHGTQGGGAGHQEPAKPASKPAMPTTTDLADQIEKGEPPVGSAPAPAPVKRGPSESEAAPTTPDAVLAVLREGNTRWVKGKSIHPNVDMDRRQETGEKGQKPFATILTCSDSRIPTERVFDRGLGDLFVVRVAGNTAGASEGGSIEYAIEHLKTPVLVVMGHTRCGAVAAASSGANIEGPVGAVIEQIKPAVERARASNGGAKDQELANAVMRENVWQSVFTLLRSSKLLRDKCKSGELRIVGAVYNVAEGTVDFMGPHPWQSELIVAFEARLAKQGAAQAEATKTHDDH